METLDATSSLPLHCQPITLDEISMQQSLFFADGLKDLKKLRTQLYSAADYFELSYTEDDQKQMVADTLKDYAIKAIVNTVDHLGSVSCKVNDFLDEKVEEVSGTKFRISCVEQRIRTCQEYIDREGIAQQSSVRSTTKYDKCYMLPAIRDTMKETPSSSSRKEHSPPRPARLPRLAGTFTFNGTTHQKELDKRTVSPHRFPLLRSGSLASRTTPPKPSRSTTPSRAVERQYPRRSASMHIPDDKKEKIKDIERQPSKSKRLLKSLLSRRKSKKDETLYTYLDEY